MPAVRLVISGTDLLDCNARTLPVARAGVQRMAIHHDRTASPLVSIAHAHHACVVGYFFDGSTREAMAGNSARTASSTRFASAS